MERQRFESELGHLELRERFFPVRLPILPKAATLGFEFDLNYGVDDDVFAARQSAMIVGAAPPGEGEAVTEHVERDGSKKMVDGFSTKVDGPRIEISTTPIEISNTAEFTTMVKNVTAFASELQKAAPKKQDTSITVAGVAGHPMWLEHPRTIIKHLPIVVHRTGSRVNNALKYPTGTALWAAPQATLTLPLANIGTLIDQIQKSEKEAGGPGVALTGPPGLRLRLGLRSDLAFTARERMLKDRRAKLGTLLSDGTKVSATDYSPAVASLVTLLAMYLLTSEVTDPKDDVERFAKGSLPINVKTPFWQIHKFALSTREKQVFDELYGTAATRVQLYKLARPTATSADDNRRLFPARTHADLDRFHAAPLTWKQLVEFTVKETPLKVTKANSIPKAHHALGDEILFACLSSKIDWDKTKPRIAVELRRIGWASVPWKSWDKLMTIVRELTRKVNQ